THPFQPRAIRAATPDSRCLPLHHRALLGLNLVTVATICQIQPAIRAQKWTVEAGGVGREIPSRQYNFTSVGNAVIVCVIEANEIGWRSDVEALPVPNSPSRHREFIGKDLAPIIDPIPIQVLQKADAEFRVRLHLFSGDILPR